MRLSQPGGNHGVDGSEPREALLPSSMCLLLFDIDRERKDEIESAWWQEHSELAEGPKAPPKSGPVKEEGTGGKHDDGATSAAAAVPSAATESGSMSRTVVDVAARRREMLEKSTTATSWEVLAKSHKMYVKIYVRGQQVSYITYVSAIGS